MYADIMCSRQQDYLLQIQHYLFAYEDLVNVNDNSYVVIIYNEIAFRENEKSCCQSLKHCCHFFDINMLITQVHVKSIRKCLTSS